MGFFPERFRTLTKRMPQLMLPTHGAEAAPPPSFAR
jgi:hypothetical protein